MNEGFTVRFHRMWSTQEVVVPITFTGNKLGVDVQSATFYIARNLGIDSKRVHIFDLRITENIVDIVFEIL